MEEDDVRRLVPAAFETGISAERLKANWLGLYHGLMHHLTDEGDPEEVREARLAEWLKTHSPHEALEEWADWELGDPTWANAFLRRLATLVNSKMRRRADRRAGRMPR